jgi:hypothetical protein
MSMTFLGLVGLAVRMTVLSLPTCLMLASSLRHTGAEAVVLWIGTAIQAAAFVVCVAGQRQRGQALGPSVIALYLIALAWLWWGEKHEDWYAHLVKAIFLVVPLLVFGYQTLMESGAPAMRRARMLAHRLASRKEWPADLNACRALPDVKALRAALNLDASPALVLLDHPRPEVRVAALAALEFRKDWRPGQAELVLQMAQRAEQPAIRAAAVTALGNLDDRALIETVSQFLHDTSWEVRKAAMEALLWDTERRWGWIRFAVRRILADPLFLTDGPLAHDGLLTPEAIKDLTAWCAEKGTLAARSAQTLGVQFSRELSERPDQAMVQHLRQLLADPHTPAVLRLELGRVLEYHQELDLPLLERLLDPSNPAPLRLIATEAMLAEHGEEEPGRHAAEAALRDLARLPNREIALATADVVQRRLGVDLGLGLGQPLPPVHSRQAAEITRRVMVWAAQYDATEDVADSRATPQKIPG